MAFRTTKLNREIIFQRLSGYFLRCVVEKSVGVMDELADPFTRNYVSCVRRGFEAAYGCICLKYPETLERNAGLSDTTISLDGDKPGDSAQKESGACGAETACVRGGKVPHPPRRVFVSVVKCLCCLRLV